jgi:hypothetical protein
LAETLEHAARKLRELAAEYSPVSRRRTTVSLPDGLIEQLRSMERSAAAQHLATLPHKQLGDILMQVGGPSHDKKRDKEWLVNRILWHLFDFQAGHEIIKGSR